MSTEEFNTAPISDTVLSAVRRWSDFDSTSEEMGRSFEDYHRYLVRKVVFIMICLLTIFVVAGLAITVGSYNITFTEAYRILWEHLTNDVQDTTKDYIVVDLRAPRIVVGIITGAGLAVAGVVMQSTLLNPLADPYTTGISSGASFGATLAFTAGASITTGQFAIVVNAFVFALIPMAMILGVSKIKNSSPTMMIMAGIAVMYIFNALTTVLKLWADPNSLSQLYEWQVGSVSMTSWDEVPIMIVVTLAGIISMQIVSRKLNVLATGEESANALGLNAGQMRMLCLLIVSLMTATIVSFTGLIGFVGLVAPHIARIFVGADNRYLIPASASLGAALLVVADLVGRIIVQPATLQAGVMMAFLGGPMFLWLIMRRQSRVWG